MLILAFAGAVVVHHSGIAVDAMHHDGMAVVAELCLSTLVVVGTGAVALLIGRATRRWCRPRQLWTRIAEIVPAVPVPRARPGPPLVLVLCSLRR